MTSVPVLADAAGVGEARVLEQVGPVEGAAHGREVAGGLQAGEEEPASVGGEVRVHQGRLVPVPGLGPRHLPESHLEAEVPPEDVGAGAEQRDLDDLAAARQALLEHGGEYAGERGEAGDVVTDPAPGVERVPLAVGHLHREPRASPEGADVVGRAVAFVTLEAVPADAAVDRRGWRATVASGSRSSLSSASGRRLVREHVGGGQEGFHPARAVLGLTKVQDHAALAPVVEGEGRVRQSRTRCRETRRRARIGSPAGGSTLMTSAPQSARSAAADGAATQTPSSTTRRSARAASPFGSVTPPGPAGRSSPPCRWR